LGLNDSVDKTMSVAERRFFRNAARTPIRYSVGLLTISILFAVVQIAARYFVNPSQLLVYPSMIAGIIVSFMASGPLLMYMGRQFMAAQIYIHRDHSPKRYVLRIFAFWIMCVVVLLIDWNLVSLFPEESALQFTVPNSAHDAFIYFLSWVCLSLYGVVLTPSFMGIVTFAMLIDTKRKHTKMEKDERDLNGNH
jgi:hypothetical protein